MLGHLSDGHRRATDRSAREALSTTQTDGRLGKLDGGETEGEGVRGRGAIESASSVQWEAMDVD